MAQVLTANRLTDGRVVFLTPDGGWSPRLAAARLSGDEQQEAELTAAGEQAEAACEVVGPYLIEVREEAGTRVAAEIREAIRASGPTVQAGRF